MKNINKIFIVSLVSMLAICVGVDNAMADIAAKSYVDTAVGLREATANKTTSITTDTGSNVKFPTVKAVEDYVGEKVDTIALTPGPAGPAGADGPVGPAGPAGADGATGPAGSVNEITTTGDGFVVTSVSGTDTVTVTKANVQIPIGSPSATSYATIWVE